MKFETLGMPLLGVDLTMAQYSDILLQYVSVATIFSFVAALTLPFLVLHYKHKGQLSLYQRVFKNPELSRLELRSLLCVILSSFVWFGLIKNGIFTFAGIKLNERPQAPVFDYIGDGDLISFTISFHSYRNPIKKYQLRTETLEKIRNISPPKAALKECSPDEKPDIIAVMVESMFDPVQIPAIHFSEDPLGPVRNLGHQESKSYLYVPSYAGNTANTEFEFLTGSTHRFFPLGTVQYQNHIYSPANSIARLLKTSSYRSIAIHNYSRNFWRRDQVYPLLGFEKYYGIEDLKKKTTVNFYDNHDKPTDEALANFLPKKLEELSDYPGFYFIVTMGTHGPYEKYLNQATQKISLSTQIPLKERSIRLLTNYTNFLADSSKSLGEMFRQALGRSKPTVIIYFGDHMPGMPYEEPYHKTGYYEWLANETGVRSQLIKTVPLHVLNNFGCKIDLPRVISSNCFGSHVISQLYPDIVSKNEFWKYNLEFCKNHPTISDGLDYKNLQGDFADYAAMMYKNLFEWSDNNTKSADP